ncbi:MAG: hypothetical protein ACR2H7_01190 [Actinomycetota bacterium]
MNGTRTVALALAVGCALLAACGGDGGGDNAGGAGDDALSQKIYQGTQQSLRELDVGVGNLLESGAQFSVFGHDPDAETSERFTGLQDGDTFSTGDYTFEVLEIGEDDKGSYAEVRITPSPT